MEVTSAAPAVDDTATRRSRQNLQAGLCALQRGDLETADLFMLALEREGEPGHYRELSLAFLQVAAR